MGNDKLTTTTQQLVVSINLAGAVRAGGYEYGRRMVAVPAGVVAQLSPAARDVLARLLADGDPPVLREASEHGTYYSDSVAKLPAASWEAVAAYLDQVAAMWAGYEARRATERVEREAREAAEREQWVQQALAGGIPALLYRGSTYDEWRLTESTWADDPRLAGLRADAQVEADVRNAQARVDKEQAGAAKEAAKVVKEAERLAWIAEHGSTLLKRCVAENISCGGVYLDERLALERPGWQWEDEVEGASRDPHNPGLAAFQLLDEARETLPEAERAEARLMFWVRGCDCAERGYFDEHDPYNCGRWKGYVVGASFLGKAIVYGADEED